MSEINVVPYIDVMLVLLVIFMITAPLLKTGVEVDLPNTEAQPAVVSQDIEPMVLSIIETGDWFLNISDNPDTAISKVAASELARKALILEPARPVLVAADESVVYGSVMEAMAMLQVAGASKVQLMSDPLR